MSSSLRSFRATSVVFLLLALSFEGRAQPNRSEGSLCPRAGDPVTEFGRRYPIALSLDATLEPVEVSHSGARYLRVRIQIQHPERGSWLLSVRDKDFRLLQTVSPQNLEAASTSGSTSTVTLWTRRLPGSGAIFDLESAGSERPSILLTEYIAMPEKSGDASTYYSLKRSNRPDYKPLYGHLTTNDFERRLGDYVGLLMGSWSDSSWCCSGVVVAPGLFLTNWHCGGPPGLPKEGVWSERICRDVMIDLSWDGDGLSREHSCVEVIEKNEELDFALLRIRPIGAIEPLRAATIDLRPQGSDEEIMLIHHPECRMKQISTDCFIESSTYENWRTKTDMTDFTHRCDSEGGSSGGPLFNAAGKLVGLHHLGFAFDPSTCSALDSFSKAVQIAQIFRFLEGRHPALAGSLSVSR